MSSRIAYAPARNSSARWARVAVIAQGAFVLSWLVAAFWQGSRYDPFAHSISDMYAVTAPDGLFLVVVLTLCGLATVLFAVLAVWPALRTAGWTAAVGSALLALSIFGLGNALSPIEREGCRLADPGCTAADQTANLGGTLDALLSTVGILFFIAAAFFLAAAMKRVPGWSRLVWPARVVGIAVIALTVALAGAETADLGGLFERLLAAVGAAAIAALALRLASNPAR
jgi:hypothetical protein